MTRLLIIAIAFAPTTADAFCGFYIDTDGAEMFNNATQVVLMREGTRTVLSMQNTYEGPIQDFAIVVPVPTVLHEGDVRTIPKAIFARVNSMSAPPGADARPPAPKKQETARFRLELHVPEQHGIYFSAWGDGDVVTDHDASDGNTVTYRRRYIWGDGCTWEASETLTPIEVDQYRYEYREAPASCPKGATPDTGATTPRDGKVSVHRLDANKPLTPLTAWSRGWDKPRT